VGSTQNVTLVLDARLDDKGSIQGSVKPARGEPRHFSGWLGLAAAITELADRTPGASPHGRDCENQNSGCLIDADRGPRR
jgi:hypothetical protein